MSRKLNNHICRVPIGTDSFYMEEDPGSLTGFDDHIDDDQHFRTWTRQLRSETYTIHAHHNTRGVYVITEPEPHFGIGLNKGIEEFTRLAKFITTHIPADKITENIISIQFQLLAEKWKRDSRSISLVRKTFQLDSYQEIVAMGEKVIPYLLADLMKTNNYWFEALKQIAGHSPIKKENYNNFEKMTNDWIEWGRLNNHITF